MSDTPRTDKSEVCFSSLCNPKDAMWVPSKVSRELERENVNLRDVLHIYNITVPESTPMRGPQPCSH